MDLKAWRDGLGLSQQEAADRLGVTRSAYSNYESGSRVAPPAVLDMAGCEAARPDPDSEKAEADRIVDNVVAMDPRNIPPDWMPKGTRRPTAQEIREFPHRYAGPDVWLKRHDPPIRYPNAAIVTISILKGSGTGHGDYSTHLVGSTKGVDPDSKSGLAGKYRPFRMARGQATSNDKGPAPKGAKAKPR